MATWERKALMASSSESGCVDSAFSVSGMTFIALFPGFNFIPLLQNGRCIVVLVWARENMRMSPDEFSIEGFDDVIKVKPPLFPRKLTVENNLKEQISQLFS